jgi:prevent-host-death family protein
MKKFKYSIADARNSFAAVVREAETFYPVEITRRGNSVAIIMSIEEYKRLKGATENFKDTYHKFKNEFDISKYGMEEHEFENLRDRSPGRKFSY